MIVSIIIAAISAVLVLYWFRYSCILMLRSSSAEDPVSEAADSQFTCVQVRELLRGETQLEGLERALARDYRLVRYLMEHAAGLNLNSIEDRILVLDYRLMQWYYRIARNVAPAQARGALAEMADVLGVLTSRLDQRAGARSAA